MSALFEAVSAVNLPGHFGHILKMALSAFVTNRAILRVMQHKPL
jgi:hypothetical protein